MTDLRETIKDANGLPKVAPGFVNPGNYNGVFLGFRWPVAQGTIDIYDYALPANMLLQGGTRMITTEGGTPADLDVMEMEIVDDDNSTGMFDGTNPNGMNPFLVDLGYEVGVDVISIFKYVRDEQVSPDDAGKRYEYKFESAAFVCSLLKLRCKYDSDGTGDDIIVKCSYKGYEA